jgi:hypothetical protein
MKQTTNQKPEAKPLEINDDELIDILTNYEIGGLKVYDEDPAMRYFFAANDDDKIRPDGIHRVMELGYRVSEKKHNSVDCVLMEIPRDRWERMQKLKHRARIKGRAEKMAQVRRDIGNNFVDLSRNGGDWS